MIEEEEEEAQWLRVALRPLQEHWEEEEEEVVLRLFLLHRVLTARILNLNDSLRCLSLMSVEWKKSTGEVVLNSLLLR